MKQKFFMYSLLTLFLYRKFLFCFCTIFQWDKILFQSLLLWKVKFIQNCLRQYAPGEPELTFEMLTPTCIHVTGYIMNYSSWYIFSTLWSNMVCPVYKLLSTCVFVKLSNIYIFQSSLESGPRILYMLTYCCYGNQFRGDD